MNTGIKSLLVLVVIIIGLYLFVSTVVAKPQEALGNCYTDSQRNLDIYKQKISSVENKQTICTDQKGEIDSLKQCINNTYGKYGHYQTAIARRKMSLSKPDPLIQIVSDHNQACSQFTELKETSE